MKVNGREITIDHIGALWAYRLGYFYGEDGMPFVTGTPHAYFWLLGRGGHRFVESEGIVFL